MFFIHGWWQPLGNEDPPTPDETGILCLMVRHAPLISEDEFVARLEAAPPPTPDDVSITFDGRRLDSKEAVQSWWAEVEPLIEADRVSGRLPTVEEMRGA